MADGVETRLREELRRVDVPVRPPLDRVASRATRLRRRRIGATGVVAAILAAGLVLPLATLGRFGTEKKQEPAGEVRAADLSVVVPDGWDSRLVEQANGALRLEVANYRFPREQTPIPTEQLCPVVAGPQPPFSCREVVELVQRDDLGGTSPPVAVEWDADDGTSTPSSWIVRFEDVEQVVHGPRGRPGPDCARGPWSVRIDATTGEVLSAGGSGQAVPCEEEGSRLGPEQVRIVVVDQGPEIIPDTVDVGEAATYRDGDFESMAGPFTFRAGDFGARFEFTPDEHSLALRNVRIQGVPLTIYAEFGSKPAPKDLLATVNATLATLQVTPADASPDPQPEPAPVVTIGTPPGEGVVGWLPPSFEPAEGWYVAATGPMDPDLGSIPLSWASNVPFAEEDLAAAEAAGKLGQHPVETLRTLPPDGVVVVAQIVWPEQFVAPLGRLPELRVADATVHRSWEGQPAPNVPEYVFADTLDHTDGRPLVIVRVFFGTLDPSTDVLAAADAQLSRLVLPDPYEVRELRTHTDIDDGASIAIPADWTWHEDPVPNLQSPRILFAAGSWPFPEGGECGPVPALEAMPADGAFLWLLEYDSVDGVEDPERDLPPRPAHFTLDGLEPVIPECSAVEGLEQYILRFRDAGRWFQFQVSFGPEATDGRRGQAVAAMDDFEVTAPIPAGCPYDLGPWSDPDCPASTWVRSVVEEAGFGVTSDTGSALAVANGDRPAFDIWAFVPDTAQPPWDRGLEQVLTDEGYEWWRGWGTDVYFDGTRVAWFADGLVVYLSAAYVELPLEEDIEAIVRASLRVDYDAIDTRP